MNEFAYVYQRFYGQRPQVKLSGVERRLVQWRENIRCRVTARRSRRADFVRRVNSHESGVAQLIANQASALRYMARTEGVSDNYIAAVFAAVRSVSERELGLRHFDQQLIGGFAMVKGMIAEMETGQGKTVTATLAVTAAALAGFPTHVITVNEYLAKRDAETLKPIYEAFGLSVGVVTADMDESARRAGYACDITYCTNKQVAFDYLRDRIEIGSNNSNQRMQLESLWTEAPVKSRLLLQGLYFAVIDEADSILIDEAVTPLIISTAMTNNSKQAAYETALLLAQQLEMVSDFKLHREYNQVELTKVGREKMKVLAEREGGIWKSSVIREELATQALRARHLFVRDQQYLVADDKIQIIDEYTGRTMPDRSWEGGLHQMIELKEGVTMTGDKETLARISYQRFFRRYLNLAGMTGTGREVARELRQVYDLEVMTIPPAQTIRRRINPDQVFSNQARKWDAICKRIIELHKSGRPVLVGTRSVEASERLSGMLQEQGIDHQLLNARQDHSEAKIVAKAGEYGQITVATNMAGRGTDIKLPEAVRQLGGLQVIMTERHDSRRIDRQLFGRCGRQGDPGEVDTMVALDDELIVVNLPETIQKFVSAIAPGLPWLTAQLNLLLFVLAQKFVERRHFNARVNVQKMDEQFSTMLAFTGEME